MFNSGNKLINQNICYKLEIRVNNLQKHQNNYNMENKGPDEVNEDRLQSQEQMDSKSQRIFNKKNSSEEEYKQENKDIKTV